jgi:hypothetical protein
MFEYPVCVVMLIKLGFQSSDTNSRPLIKTQTSNTTRVVGRQPNAPAAFTPAEIPGSHFQRLNRSQGTWICRKEPRKKSQVTPPGIDPGTVRLVVQRLNHYPTPGPFRITGRFVYVLPDFLSEEH